MIFTYPDGGLAVTAYERHEFPSTKSLVFYQALCRSDNVEWKFTYLMELAHSSELRPRLAKVRLP